MEKRSTISPSLYSICNYFFPRLLFLNSSYAPNIHYGDIVEALTDFPEFEKNDLSYSEFWEHWMERWKLQGEKYIKIANSMTSQSNYCRAHKSAAACYHWAEFMYFGDEKIILRKKVRESFKESIKDKKIEIVFEECHLEGIKITYIIVYPDKMNDSYPCVLISNGLDSMTEIEPLSLAEYYLEKGIAVILFEGPGQGINLGHTPIPLEMEYFVELLLKKLNNNEKIDKKRLGFLGISFGGYIALRIAQKLGNYFKCIINISGGPVLRNFISLARRLKTDFSYAFMQDDNSFIMQDIFDKLKIDIEKLPSSDIISIHGVHDDIFPIKFLKKLDQEWGDKHRLIVYNKETHACLNVLNQYNLIASDILSNKLLN